LVIKLSQILNIENSYNYKVHLACWNKEIHPLDVFVRDRSEWDMWNMWRFGRDDFNRRYIFSLIDFYPEPGVWLFGGIYEVLERGNNNHSHSYKIRLTNQKAEFIGRLKIYFERPGRIRAIKLENFYEQMMVSELLKDTYKGEKFPGFEYINHDFLTLETIFQVEKMDWKAALQHVKGVYAIFDKSNGCKYVGSAYGETGVWSRWAEYIISGHGGNDELTSIIAKKGIDYARKNFQITLLEYFPARTDDQVIRERETFWKEALISKGKYGYNRN